MFELDDDFLVSLGLGSMPAEEKEAFLAYIYEELKLRVGTVLSADLSDSQLDQFERIMDSGDSNKALSWLQSHCPNYKDVVRSELNELQGEITAGKDKLLQPGIN